MKDTIKKANLLAMKNKDAVARAIYSVVLNKIMMQEVKLRGTNQTLCDADVLNILQKTTKELEEEKLAFEKVGNTQKAQEISKQKELIVAFLPTMLDKTEIEKIILGLEDKSIGNVMKYFKQNHNGTCDMTLVRQVLDGLK